MKQAESGSFDISAGALHFGDSPKVAITRGVLTIHANGHWNAEVVCDSTAVLTEAVDVSLVGDVYAWQGKASVADGEGRDVYRLTGAGALVTEPAAAG